MLTEVLSGESGSELSRMARVCMSVVPKRSEKEIVSSLDSHFMYHLLLITALLLMP